MRKTILDKIKTGLETEIGPNSSTYADLKIEEIRTKLPEKVTTNYFIGLSIDRADSSSVEIGKYHPSMKEYECFVIVFLKNADYESGQIEIDKIVRRITKFFALDNGSLNGLSETTDGITEQVVSYSLFDYNYISGSTDSSLAHTCTIRLRIRTNLTI